jgi:hypothetical protein
MKWIFWIVAVLFARQALASDYLGADGPTYTTTDERVEYETGLVLPADWGQRKIVPQLPPLREDLPDKFSWQDKLTPVRDQGSCGSCWAFSAQATLADVMALHGKGSLDLSEQWMVSCDNESSGCGGGWYHSAFDLVKRHGNVLESTMPYKGSNLRCPSSIAYTEHKVQLYKELSSGVASSQLIKQAIYLYGPISVAVSVGGDFSSYKSGIFNASVSGSLNHAVNLVGWDDTVKPAHWIMRNSWGPKWGENGYMRIAYGSRKIGYAATYVDIYGPVPHGDDVNPNPDPTPTPTPPPGPTPCPECPPCTFWRWISRIF